MKKYPKRKIKQEGFAQISTQDMTEKKKKVITKFTYRSLSAKLIVSNPFLSS